jgi:hypothetical protein
MSILVNVANIEGKGTHRTRLSMVCCRGTMMNETPAEEVTQ